jgi:hypothetical protein
VVVICELNDTYIWHIDYRLQVCLRSISDSVRVLGKRYTEPDGTSFLLIIALAYHRFYLFFEVIHINGRGGVVATN